jgi:C1A family cysteine protease
MNMVRKYGWTPDLPDHRDMVYSVPRRVAVLPKKVDLSSQCPEVYDQLSLGSCTANAIGAAHQFDQMKQKKAGVFTPSRLFIYRCEREMMGTIDQDSGAMIRDGFKAIADQGVCSEKDWPYVISKFRVRPPQPCFQKALENQALTYYAVKQDLNQLKGCLAEGFPFVFGFSVYDSFESSEVAKTGIVRMPKRNESQLGGHAVMAVGYDDKKKMFLVRNSWGRKWGIAGYCMMPYAYLMDSGLARDMWTVRLVE